MSDGDGPVPCTIVGAGPAGLSAALWAERYTMEYRWLDRDGEVGGLLDRIENRIVDYVGADFEDGAALRRTLRHQVARREELAPEAVDVARLTFESDRWHVHPARCEGFESRTVVLATGTAFRRLEIPGEREGLGKYVSQSTSRDAIRFGGRTVAIVGGGDAALEGALQLVDEGSHVHMLLRSSPDRARDQFLVPARRHPRVFVHPIPSTVERIEPIPSRDSCRLHVEIEGNRTSMEVAALFVKIGVEPLYPTIEPAPNTDEDGHIVVDRTQQTTAPQLYAAGEVTDTQPPSIAVSVGGAARAVHAAARTLDLA